MLRRIIGFSLPVVGTATLLGAGYSAKRFGLIEQGTWAWLWQALVAVAFLAGAFFALRAGAKRILLILATAAAVQTLGTLIYVLDKVGEQWDSLVWTGVAVALTLLGMGLYELYRMWRARRTGEFFVNADLAEEGVDPEELSKIRDNLVEALDLLRRAGRGRNAVYDLPWFLVVGRPAAGKTFAIKESGLTLPVKKDWVKGVGGTYSCDFFFTNDLIFMDTPGRWVRQGADEAAQSYWGALLRLLKKYRGRQPLDGLVVVVSAEDLLGITVDSEDQVDIQDQAANIREIIDLMHEHLRFRFPVYLLVSKTDLAGGFSDFFWGVPAQRRHEILGWSNPDPNDHDLTGMVRHGLHGIVRRLESFRMEMLTKSGRTSRNRRLFFFTEELKQIEEPLSEFAEMLFHDDPSGQTPIFRGFYFTSAVQEGSPVSRAMSALAKNLGVGARPAAAAAVAEEGGKRSYFLLELFRELMVGDDGLIGRTFKHRVRQRRNTLFGVFLPAGIALGITLLAGLSLFLNWRLYRAIDHNVPGIVEQLQAQGGKKFDYDSLKQSLELTEELRRYHIKLTNVNPFRRIGMRHSNELANRVFRLYEQYLRDQVLLPTFEQAFVIATHPDSLCADRVDVLHGVVWLRLGKRFESSQDELKGLDIIWGEWPLEGAQRGELRAELLSQFGYLANKDPAGGIGNLLAGFEMEAVAEGIVEDCPRAGSGSAVDSFATFQKACESWVTGEIELQRCYRMLRTAANWSEKDFERYFENINGLTQNLKSLGVRSPEAKRSFELLEQLNLESSESSGCTEAFVRLIPDLQNFAIKYDMEEECRMGVQGLAPKDRFDKQRAIATAQKERLKPAADVLRRSMARYFGECQVEMLRPLGLETLKFEVVEKISSNYRRKECLGFRKRLPESASVAAMQPKPTATRAPAPARTSTQRRPTTSSPVTAKRVGPFENYCSGPSKYSFDAFERSRSIWTEQYEAATVDPDMTESGRASEQNEVRSAVRQFGRNAEKSWLECLGKVRLAETDASIPVWLKAVGRAPEYKELFKEPAFQATEISASAAEEPFSAVTLPLAPLMKMDEFAEEKVGQYQEMLLRLAQQFEIFETNPDAFGEFRAAYLRAQDGNQLVALKTWVGSNIANFSEGRFTTLFNEPVEQAERFVEGDSYIRAQWEQLLRRYRASLAQKFPFDPGGDELAEPSAVVAVFGADSGLVQVIGADPVEAGPEAREWLDAAQSLMTTLFRADTDDLKPLHLTLEFGEVTPSTKELKKKFLVRFAAMDLGRGAGLDWDEDAGSGADYPKIHLFGDEVGVSASVSARISKRKTTRGWGIGDPYKKDVEEFQFENGGYEGSWAALRLLVAGMSEAGVNGGPMTLTYKIPVELSKKKTEEFTLTYKLTSERLPAVLELLENGFPAPPDDFAN